MALTSDQIMASIANLDIQAEAGYQAYIRERNNARMIARIEAINQLRYQYPDSPCEYNEPRNKWGGWFPAVLVGVAGWAAMAGLVRWLI